MDQYLQKELVTLINTYSGTEEYYQTPLPGVHFIQSCNTGMKTPVVCQPSICIIVQGAKKVMLEKECFSYTPFEYLMASFDLPLRGEVIQASPSHPYLSIQINIDVALLREVMLNSKDQFQAVTETKRGLFIGKADTPLLESVLRLIRLLETPADRAFLHPLNIKEIYYRLLNSEHGHRIAQLAITGSTSDRIAKAIEQIKRDFAKPLRIEKLAQTIHMSASSFYHHFKQVTAMSPLQYQKYLRLMEARRLMLSEQASATNAAHQVGYESPSQFNREYTRLFGTPPFTDVERIRSSLSNKVKSA